MNAPLIWIVFPVGVGLLLLTLRKWQRLALILAIIIAVLLAWLAWELPLGRPIFPGAGLPAFQVAPSLTVLGRQFILIESLRPVLIIIYLGLAVWFGGALTSATDRLFPGLAFLIAALLTASLAVRPGLFAALFVQVAALICIPILAAPARPFNPGILRFITFQTFGTVLVLFGDWLIPTTEVVIPGSPLIWRAVIVTMLGLGMMSAMAPFHTWIPMLAEKSPIYPTAFILFILPTATSILSLDYIQRFNLAGVPLDFFAILRIIGALMALGGGVWAFLERQMERILAFAVVNQLGLNLLALSLAEPSETGTPLIGILFAQRIVLGFGLAVWALALARFQQDLLSIKAQQPGQAQSPGTPGLRLRDVQGLARRFPVTTASIFLATLSLAGFPLLASFPTNLALWTALSTHSREITILTLFGSIFLAGAGLRMLAVLVMDPQNHPWSIEVFPLHIILSLIGWAIFIFLGLTPQAYFPYLTAMALIFTNPTP